MKRNQEPRFLITEKIKDKSFKRLTGVYEHEERDENYSKHVVPLNRMAFRIALKRIHSPYESKKQGTKALLKVKVARLNLEEGEKSYKKEKQRGKRILKAIRKEATLL